MSSLHKNQHKGFPLLLFYFILCLVENLLEIAERICTSRRRVVYSDNEAISHNRSEDYDHIDALDQSVLNEKQRNHIINGSLKTKKTKKLLWYSFLHKQNQLTASSQCCKASF